VNGVLDAARARAKMASILGPFWRARGAPRTLFTARTLFNGKFYFFQGFTWTGHSIEAFSVGGGGIKWPVQHRFCFNIDSVNDFDIDICLAVGFVRFRSHSKSFAFPIDEIDDIPPKFERAPSTL